MPAITAEQHFVRGRHALLHRRPREAHAHLRLAVEVEKSTGVVRPQMRYISYYGLSLAMSKGGRPTREAVAFCEEAAAQDPHDPEILLNLARIYLLATKRTRGLATIARGLKFFPGHRGFQRLLEKVDRRSAPVVGLLGRDHPLNRSLGRLRASLFPGREGRDPAPHRHVVS